MTLPKWLINVINRAVIPSNRRVYTGRIKETPLIVAKKGITVITPNGLGTIRSIDTNGKLTVDLYRGYPKEFSSATIKQYAIVHAPTNQIFPVNSTEYRYIYTINQPIEYRITNRNLVQLTDSCKDTLRNVYVWNKLKHGHIIINELKKGNIKLT